MNVIPHPTLPSQLLLGYRVASDTGDLTSQEQAQQVLVAIAKATYQLTSTGAVLAETQVPLQLRDGLFNPVVNADFTEIEETPDHEEVPTGWDIPASTATVQRLTESQAGQTLDYLRIQGAGAVRQTLTFDQPLAGRTFQFRFRARLQNTPAASLAVGGITVSSASNQPLVDDSWVISRQSDFAELTRIGTWPASVTDREARVVLSGIATAAVDFDQIQLIEGTHPFAFNEPIQTEQDLALFKPFTDVVVLGVPHPPPSPSGVLLNDQWSVRVSSGSEEMVGQFSTRAADNTAIPSNAGRLIGLTLNGQIVPLSFTGSTPFLFGWQPRTVSPRLGLAGQAATFDPAAMKLPLHFTNRFYNGGWYQPGDRPAFSHPPPGATVAVTASANYLRGDGTVAVARETYSLPLPDPGPQFILTYRQGQAGHSPVVRETHPLQADTVVFDLNAQTLSVVWRGIWAGATADLPLDRLIRLEFV